MNRVLSPSRRLGRVAGCVVLAVASTQAGYAGSSPNPYVDPFADLDKTAATDTLPTHLGGTDPFVGGPWQRQSHASPESIFAEKTTDDVGSVEASSVSPPFGEPTFVDPTVYAAPVAAAAVPPVPPAVRVPPSPETAAPASSLHAFAPWNPGPATGVAITDPAKAYPSVKVSGFFQVDAVWFNQDDANKVQVGDAPDGADFRRARLSASGDVWENIGYMIEMDFAAPGRPSFMDVYGDFRDMLSIPATVRVGQWRMPFGMTGSTSVRELSFIERPLPFAFVPFRQIGVGLLDSVDDDNITWAVAGFRYPTDVYGGNVGDSGGYSLATRETIVFGGETDDDDLFHLGGSYSYLNSSFDTFRTLSQPEVFVSEVAGPVVPADAFLNVPAFVDTGLYAAEQANLFGGEIAARSGSFWTQAEIYSMVVDRIAGDNAAFWGAYAHVGYILTGETRPYSRANGVFTRVKPNEPVRKGGGLGAWEIAGRWSMIDLTDSGIEGGRLNDLTAGLNWYLNPRTKLQLNYIHAFLDRQPTGESNADIIAARAQIDF